MMEKRTERLQVCLNDSEVSAIDEWRFEHRFPSRAAAIRELIGRGLAGHASPTVETGVASREIGILESGLSRITEGDSYCISDIRSPDQPLIYVSPGFETLTGYSAEEAVGRNCRFLQGPDTDKDVVGRIGNAVREYAPIVFDLINYRKNGAPFAVRLTIAYVGGGDGGAPLIAIGRQTELTGEEAQRLLKGVAAAPPKRRAANTRTGDALTHFA